MDEPALANPCYAMSAGWVGAAGTPGEEGGPMVDNFEQPVSRKQRLGGWSDNLLPVGIGAVLRVSRSTLQYDIYSRGVTSGVPDLVL